MKKSLPATAVATLLSMSSAVVAADGLLPNPSFEKVTEGRPSGFRIFPSPPEVEGDFYVLDGAEGDSTHTGRRALQFHFPDGPQVSQAVWMADPAHGGCPVQPGRHKCSFWIKAEEMLAGFHVWVSLTGYGAGNNRLGEIARSDYLNEGSLPAGQWKQVEFTFDVPVQDGVERLAPSIVFKTKSDASANPVPPETRVFVDDLQIEAE